MEKDYYEILLRNSESRLDQWLSLSNDYVKLAVSELKIIKDLKDCLQEMKKEVA